MKTPLADMYRENPIRACRLALRRTLQIDERKRMDKINELLGLDGTEAIRGEWQNGYWCDIVAVYCNTGDTYAPTVIQVRPEFSGGASRFIVSSMGYFVEQHQEKLGIV